MKRHDGGYVLVYVVVVIVILCILIPAACANSLKNLTAQQSSIERMRQLYTAEGQIERFAAELQATAETLEGDGTEAAEKSFANEAFDIANGMIQGSREEFSPDWEQDETGDPRCGISLVSAAGNVVVKADIQVELEIKEEQGSAKITGCTITYSSYDISTAAEAENTGEEGGNPP